MVLYKKVNGERIQMSPEEEADIRAQWLESEEELKATEYVRKRQEEYPSIQEQLDMIWHDIDKDDIANKKSSWYLKIKEIKKKYPNG